MPARREEVHHAKEEGIIFKVLTNPVSHKRRRERLGAPAMECVEMELGEPDASGRRRPVAKEGSEFTLDVDTVIVAIGNSPNPLHSRTPPPASPWAARAQITADPETGATSKPGVFAGGDAVTGAATVILAMGAGKKAAAAIDEYLKNK